MLCNGAKLALHKGAKLALDKGGHLYMVVLNTLLIGVNAHQNNHITNQNVSSKLLQGKTWLYIITNTTQRCPLKLRNALKGRVK